MRCISHLSVESNETLGHTSADFTVYLIVITITSVDKLKIKLTVASNVRIISFVHLFSYIFRFRVHTFLIYFFELNFCLLYEPNWWIQCDLLQPAFCCSFTWMKNEMKNKFPKPIKNVNNWVPKRRLTMRLTENYVSNYISITCKLLQ